MKLRNVLIAAVGTLTIFSMSTSTASASGDPAGWQSAGNSDFYPDAKGSRCHTKPLPSGGGSIRLTYHRPGGQLDGKINVWEYDPDNPDDFVISMGYMWDGVVDTAYVGNFVDGSNGKAEIYFSGPCTGAPWVHMDD
ncbi:hypothetical protein ACGFWG_32820 [Streptomyces sp. NPDC048405]|uniref:hypothetical protein n=1 Tax=Streptomyces sp. NPDC048405 TaxID=3365544 RepID=UPI003712F353